jgi:two-component system, sensor histidine kinase FlrB
MIALAQIVAGWPLVVSMAAAVAVQGLRNGRRRSALNEALHELRRPLQAVALTSGPRSEIAEDPIDLAAAALERLDREINGGPLVPAVSTVDARSLVRTAVGRWQARVRLGDGLLELRWNAGAAFVHGDRRALAQALDNLIVNAIEHGGPSIVVSARRRQRRLRIVVVDSGRASRPRSRRGGPAEVLTRLAGRHRRGHGLAVVRRVASAHEGRFVLHGSPHGSTAVLELPLADDEPDRPA